MKRLRERERERERDRERDRERQRGGGRREGVDLTMSTVDLKKSNISVAN